MRTVALVLLLSFCAVPGVAQNAPVPAEKEPFHTPIFRNEHVVVSAVEVPPHQTTQLHRHDRPYLAVMLTDSTTTTNVPGRPPEQRKRRSGEVWMSDPVTHAVRNDSDAPFRATVVDFLARQSPAKPIARKATRYCNPGSKTACVTEKYLLCTDHVCVSEVEMGPGALTMRHRHSTDHMVIALNDLEMKDTIEGKPSPVVRTQKTGQVVFVDAGLTHQLENGPKPAHFITVNWK